MKLIKPSFEILSTTGDVFKDIERVGRVCYKSEDKITDVSAIPFVNMIIGKGHTAMLEHGTVYLKYTVADSLQWCVTHLQDFRINKYMKNPYSIVTNGPDGPEGYHCITTNYRVLVENNWLDDLEYQCEPTEFHEQRISVKFTCDRGVSHEFVRHRVFSFAQESTRYCNYSKDKYGKELTYILPPWVNLGVGSYVPTLHNYAWIHDGETEIISGLTRATRFLKSLVQSEENYLSLMSEEGFEEPPWTAQQARDVLPNSLKTELVMTGTVEQWKGFFKLRCNADAHPQARELAIPLQEEFKRLGYVS